MTGPAANPAEESSRMVSWFSFLRINARQIDEPPTLFTVTGFVLLAQSHQCRRRQPRVAADTFFLADSNHRFFMFALELVVSRDQVRRDFMTHLLDQLRELRRCYPILIQKSFSLIQRKQLGGRPVHDLFFLFG